MRTTPSTSVSLIAATEKREYGVMLAESRRGSRDVCGPRFSREWCREVDAWCIKTCDKFRQRFSWKVVYSARRLAWLIGSVGYCFHSRSGGGRGSVGKSLGCVGVGGSEAFAALAAFGDVPDLLEIMGSTAEVRISLEHVLAEEKGDDAAGTIGSAPQGVHGLLQQTGFNGCSGEHMEIQKSPDTARGNNPTRSLQEHKADESKNTFSSSASPAMGDGGGARGKEETGERPSPAGDPRHYAYSITLDPSKLETFLGVPPISAFVLQVARKFALRTSPYDERGGRRGDSTQTPSPTVSVVPKRVLRSDASTSKRLAEQDQDAGIVTSRRPHHLPQSPGLSADDYTNMSGRPFSSAGVATVDHADSYPPETEKNGLASVLEVVVFPSLHIAAPNVGKGALRVTIGTYKPHLTETEKAKARRIESQCDREKDQMECVRRFLQGPMFRWVGRVNGHRCLLSCPAVDLREKIVSSNGDGVDREKHADPSKRPLGIRGIKGAPRKSAPAELPRRSSPHRDTTFVLHPEPKRTLQNDHGTRKLSPPDHEKSRTLQQCVSPTRNLSTVLKDGAGDEARTPALRAFRGATDRTEVIVSNGATSSKSAARQDYGDMKDEVTGPEVPGDKKNNDNGTPRRATVCSSTVQDSPGTDAPSRIGSLRDIYLPCPDRSDTAKTVSGRGRTYLGTERDRSGWARTEATVDAPLTQAGKPTRCSRAGRVEATFVGGTVVASNEEANLLQPATGPPRLGISVVVAPANNADHALWTKHAACGFVLDRPLCNNCGRRGLQRLKALLGTEALASRYSVQDKSIDEWMQEGRSGNTKESYPRTKVVGQRKRWTLGLSPPWDIRKDFGGRFGDWVCRGGTILCNTCLLSLRSSEIPVEQVIGVYADQ